MTETAMVVTGMACPVCAGTGRVASDALAPDAPTPDALMGVVADGTGIEWRRNGEAIQYRYSADMFPTTRRPGPWTTVEHPEAIVHPARVDAIARARAQRSPAG